MIGLKKLGLNKSAFAAKFLMVAMAVALLSCNNDDEDLVGNWIKVGDFGGIKRSEAIVATVDDKVYVGFGWSQADGDKNGRRLRDLWSFDGRTWINVVKDADAPLAARSEAVSFVIGKKIYIGTGFDGNQKLSDFWSYDTQTGQWEQIDDFPGGIRIGAVAFTLTVNGKQTGFVGTGYGTDIASGTEDKYLNDIWRYDESTGWSALQASTYPVKVRDASVFIIDNKAYVVGGRSNSSTSTMGDNNFAYFDGTEWHELRKISDATDESYDDDYSGGGTTGNYIVRNNAVAFAVDGKGYLATGTSKADVWEYTVSTDLWIEKTAFEGYSRAGAVAFVLNGIPYVATGRSSSTDYDDVWIFQPNAEYNEKADQ
ncbi:MAG: galactose oxidase [Bacteroidales bacterium]|jgi:N-acetylneuraminic acid mutarotase|nr:galactose oxidase [Bacteroidales bacterium]